MTNNYDVVFVGGAIMASSTAYNLLKEDPKMKIAIIEKDPTYQHAATSLAIGAVRQQFSTKVNIRLARQSIEMFENFKDIMESKYGKPDINFRQYGYLFIVSPEKWPTAEENIILQKEEGVEVELLTANQVGSMIPDLNLEGVAGGSFCRRDGFTDPQQILTGYVNKVKELGAEFVKDEVVEIETYKGKVKGVVCKTGNKYSSNVVVNAAGPWAGLVGEMAGVEVPVMPLPFDVYACKIPIELNIGKSYTASHVGANWIREHLDGDTVIASKSRFDSQYGFNFTPDQNYYYEQVWPTFASLIKGLDKMRLFNSWRGLYEYNPHDQNAIIDEHPELEGFYLINGFSGHGVMQAPAAGRGLAELIFNKGFKTIDLSELCLKRIYNNKLCIEKMCV